jgi:hypothetical protein
MLLPGSSRAQAVVADVQQLQRRLTTLLGTQQRGTFDQVTAGGDMLLVEKAAPWLIGVMCSQQV